MDQARIEQIKQRVAAATPGPWRTGPINYADIYGADGLVALCVKDRTATVDDAAFIAHARQDVPDLLDALSEAQATIQRQAAELAEHATDHDEIDEIKDMCRVFRCQPVPDAPGAESQMMAWVCVAVPLGKENGELQIKGDMGPWDVRVLPLPSREELAREFWRQLELAGNEMGAEHFSEQDEKRVGAAIYRALGVSDGK